jgi:hypothetical protein
MLAIMRVDEPAFARRAHLACWPTSGPSFPGRSRSSRCLRWQSARSSSATQMIRSRLGWSASSSSGAPVRQGHHPTPPWRG